MQIKLATLFVAATLSWTAQGRTEARADQYLLSGFNIEGTGSGSYQSTTNFPGETGYSTSGNASFSGAGQTDLTGYTTTNLGFNIAGMHNPISVTGADFDGSGYFSLTGKSFTADALDMNLADNYSYAEIDVKLTNLSYVTSVLNGVETYTFLSGRGTISYSGDFYLDYYNIDGDFIHQYYDDSATIDLTNLSGSYFTTSVVPLPASAPMLGAALIGVAGFGYVARRRKAAVI